MNLFPYTREGRQTLIYLVLAGCGPALTAVVIWAMQIIRYWPKMDPVRQLDQFAKLADIMAAGVLIIVIALSCFVSIRAIKIGKGGIEAESNNNGSDTTAVEVSATAKVITPAPTGSDSNA